MGRHFPVRKKSGNFEQTGKDRENHTKYWKIQGILDKYYLLFFSDIKMNCIIFAKMDQGFSLKKQNIEKILENGKKILEKSVNFVSPEKWEPRTT